MNKVFSVYDINRYIKGIFSSDMLLTDIMVSGEISNYKSHYSGHMYFTLKDDQSVIKSVMFKSSAAGLNFEPENGMKVIVKGYVSVFERDGQYQLYAQKMQPDGLGTLHIAFEQLKNKLQNEGLFENRYKKALPLYPDTIGVITSSTGSVIKDIINVSSRRNKKVNIKIIPVQVQGTGASETIAKAIDTFNKLDNVEVIIVARGGGSLEELWAFNEEVVARSIFTSKIPVVSAVGHETDFTISDFVADLRAPTPSAAAELVVPDMEALKESLDSFDKRLLNGIQKEIQLLSMRLSKYEASTVFKQPLDRIYQERLKLDSQLKSITQMTSRVIIEKKSGLASFAAKLDALSPLNILGRGFLIAKNEESQIIKSIKDISEGDQLILTLVDGEAKCTVDEKVTEME